MMKSKIWTQVAFFASLSLFAGTQKVGVYTWTYRINGGTAEVCAGSSGIAVSPAPSGALTIPPTLGGWPVTYIAGDAFQGCTGLTDVALPYTITGIGNYAFKGCTGLATARVPYMFITRNLNTAFKECPSVQFRFCETQTVNSVGWHCQLFESDDPGDLSVELRNIDADAPAIMTTTRSGHLAIPSEVSGYTVRCLGRNALSGCRRITSFSIPFTVTNVDSYAFAYCESVRSAIITGGVKDLGDCAFLNCTGLVNVTISTNMTAIRDYTFFNCISLSKVVLPASVKSVGANAFYCCGSLASATIPNSVTNIGPSAFRGCDSLTELRIPDSVETIGYYAFADCGSLTNVSVPKALSGKIDSSVFDGCPDDLVVTWRGPESDVSFVSNGGVFSGTNFGSMDGKSGTAQLTLERGRGRYNSGMRATGKNGLEFAGWWTARDGGTPQYDANGACIPGEGCWNSARQWNFLGNAKLYARFGEPHHPTFFSNGGVFAGANFGDKDGKSGIVQVHVTCGKGTCNSGMRATLGGSRFLGWWTDKTGGEMQYDANGKFVPGSMCWTASGKWRCHDSPSLYARWEADEPHNLKFDSNGGVFAGANFGSMDGMSGVTQISVTCGKGSYNAGMRATRGGYAFLGWWTATSGGSMQYDANGKYVGGGHCWTADGKWQHHGNAALYARWAADEPHTLRFDPNGGVLSGGNFGSMEGESGVAQVSVTCGKGSYNAGMRATKGGAAFKGWWTAKTGGSMQYDANGKFVPNSTCWDANGKWKHHSNAALYARWQ